MKTSVKILLGVVLVIFMIPTFFFMAFSYKAKDQNFKPFHTDAAAWSRVDIGPSRFIKISGEMKDAFECKLIPDEKPHYFAEPNSPYQDSIRVSQKADTLFITYVSVKEKGDTSVSKNYWTPKSIDLYISDWQQLEINGATVNMDSSFGNQYAAKQITINNSKLNLGIPVEDENYPENSIVPAADSLRQTMSELQISGSKNQLFLNSNFNIGKLQLGLNNTEFIIRKGAIIGSASGSISPDSHLDMAGSYLQKLSGLIIK